MTMAMGSLRPVTETDLACMLEWRNHPDIRRHMFTRHVITPEEHASWWQRTRERIDQRYFVYEHAARASGIVAFTGMDPVNSHAFWAFYAAPEAPRGTGSRMLCQALDHAFFTLRLHKISAEVLATNADSLHLHARLGFAEEGVFRAHHRAEGAYLAVHRLGILAEEWQQHRPAMLARLAAKE